jgi:hypothetical protein
MMKAKKSDNPIALELNKYSSKVKEFQDYLESKPINSIGDDSTRHKEIEVQLKMMEKLPFYLSEIKRLRAVVEEGVSKLLENPIMGGDQELSPIEQGII